MMKKKNSTSNYRKRKTLQAPDFDVKITSRVNLLLLQSILGELWTRERERITILRWKILARGLIKRDTRNLHSQPSETWGRAFVLVSPKTRTIFFLSPRLVSWKNIFSVQRFFCNYLPNAERSEFFPSVFPNVFTGFALLCLCGRQTFVDSTSALNASLRGKVARARAFKSQS